MNRRRYPLVVRLARIDRELRAAAEMLEELGDDLLDLRMDANDTEERVVLLTALVGILALASGVDGNLVRTWLMAMQHDLEEAERLAAQIVEQMVTLHTHTAGEA